MNNHMSKYKATGNRGFFDEQEQVEKLSAIGNPLDMISKVIDFEMFRNTLEESLLNTDKKSNAGAKPYDVVSFARNLQKMIINHFSRLCLRY